MKEQILQTALSQFLKHGIREMSIQKLIEPLCISTKTVYKHFKNKEELLEQALYLHYAQQHQMLQELTADQKVVPLLLDVWYTAFEREYGITNLFFQDLHYYYPELERKIQSAVGDKFTGQFLRIIRKGISEGVFQDNINPELVTEGIYVLYDATVTTEQFKRFKVSPLELLLHTIVTYIRGFCTSKGIQELEVHIQRFQMLSKSRKSRKRTINHL